MTKNLSEIQNDLQAYFNSPELKRFDNNRISSKIFEIEVFLQQIKKNRDIKDNFDASICTEKIIKSFEVLLPEQFHRPVDYQYAFSMWMLTNSRPSQSLYEHIDLFIDSISEFLNYPDIKRTSTGATRCKTNVRMAIMQLRSYGILLNKNEQGTRTHFLSSFGLLIFCYLKILTNENLDPNKYDDKMMLKDPGQMTKNCIDQRIMDVIALLRNERGFEKIWSKLELFSFSPKEKNNFEKLWSKFANMVLDNLHVTAKGIKEIDKEHKVISKFISNLKDEEEFENIRKILFQRIRNLA